MTIVANNFQQPISVLDGQVWGTDTTSRVTGIHRDKKVTICHRTGSDSNPYVEITISENAWENNGHGNHDGDFVLTQGVDPNNVGLVGFSMGAAISILSAAQEKGIHGVVADSAFARASDLIVEETTRGTG